MYEYISGRLVDLNPAEAIIECGGIGYKILISLSTFSKIDEAGSEAVKLFLYHQVKEDDESLFGFYDKQERALFMQLISVSGIGAGIARTVLSSMSSDELTEAIITQNVNRIKSIKGIGLKTAQRLILELKDKVGKDSSADFNFGTSSVSAANPIRQEAASALVLLGFAKPNVEKALDTILSEDPSCKIEELIKRCLKIL